VTLSEEPPSSAKPDKPRLSTKKMGEEDFSGAGGVVDVDLQIFSNVDGFASAEIFLVNIGENLQVYIYNPTRA
jgi:hypothetical protein